MSNAAGLSRFGHVMRTFRKARKLTQLELALEAEVDLSYVSMLETGKKMNPSSETVRKVADALRLHGVSLEIFKREAAMARGMLSTHEQTKDFDLFLDILLMFEDADEPTKVQLRGTLQNLHDRMSGSTTLTTDSRQPELQPTL